MSFPSSSPAANTFLVDSLISACRTDGFYSNGNMYTPSGSDVGTYGMQTCGLLPPFGKRGDVNQHNMGMSVHPYISQLDHWSEPGSRTCRTESSAQMSNYTLSQHQSIKEESDCCMYSDKRLHKVGSPEVVSSYVSIPESCSLDGPEIPVPGYFRLSQTYANGKQQEGYNCQQPPSPNPTLMQLNRVTPKPQSSSSSSSSSSSNFAETERKNDDLVHEPDATSTPNAAESQSPDAQPESDCVEQLCSMDACVSSPEEEKGRREKRFLLVALR